MREATSARAIAESVLVWSATIRRAFAPLSEPNPSLADGEDRLSSLLQLVQHQTDQIDVLILQNKQLEQRLIDVEGQICTVGSTTTHAATTNGVSSSAHPHPPPQPVAKVAHAKRKGRSRLQRCGSSDLPQNLVCMLHLL
ncbi:hypothetical protein PI124_g16633 [Phytophthora idaei]|nr:hypothetical protein PI124_g16633 [Phytophthora idaei]